VSKVTISLVGFASPIELNVDYPKVAATDGTVRLFTQQDDLVAVFPHERLNYVIVEDFRAE
jgi:hypothetical protein